MPHPATAFIELIKATDLTNQESLIAFAKKNKQLQDEMQENLIGVYMNYVREKEGKEAKKKVEVSVEEALPFRIGLMSDYLNTLEKEEADAIVQKINDINEALTKLLMNAPKNKVSGVEAWGAEHQSAQSIEIAFSASKQNEYQTPKEDKTLEQVAEFLILQPDILEHKIKLAEKALSEYQQCLKDSSEIASQEQSRLSQKVETNQSRGIFSSHRYQNTRTEAAKAFSDYSDSLNKINKEIDAIKGKKPKPEQFSDQKEYQRALQSHHETLLNTLKEKPEQTFTKAQMLEGNTAVKNLHVHKANPISSKLAQGLSKLFNKLHQWFPNKFPNETPNFLASKHQIKASELSTKAGRKK